MRLSQQMRRGIRFAAVTMIWTWGVLAAPALLGLDFGNAVTKAAYALAGASPSGIALIFVLLPGGKDRASFLRRIVCFGRAGAKELLVTFALVPAVTVLSVFAASLLTASAPDWSKLLAYCSDPAGLLLFAAFTLLFGPLAEEIGWRGCLLDCWKDGGLVLYGAGIGLIWTLWHLPMFFISGTYQNALLAQGAVPVVCFALSTTALGVILGELANRTGSILAPILFHFTINFTGELFSLSPAAEAVRTAIFTAIALGMLLRDFILKKGTRHHEAVGPT